MNQTSILGLSLFLGIAVGVVFGILTKNMGVCIAIGIAGGTALGVITDIFWGKDKAS